MMSSKLIQNISLKCFSWRRPCYFFCH